MNLSKIILILFAVIFCDCKSENEHSPKDILIKTLDMYGDFQSMTYNLKYSSKPLHIIDTNTSDFKCYMVKSEDGEFLNNSFIIKVSNKYNVSTSIYDNGIRYFFSEEDKLYSVGTVNKEKVSRTHPFLSWKDAFFKSRFLNIYNFFLIPEKIEEFYTDTSFYSLSLEDSVHQDQEFWKVNVTHEDTEFAKNGLQSIYINKKTYQIVRIYWYLEAEYDFQLFEWNFYDQQFDTFSYNDLCNYRDSLLNIYKLEEFEPRDPESEELLPEGSIAENIIGQYFQEDREYNLSKQEAKLYLLDFWYMQCGPCVQAIPYLNELQKKYGEKGLQVLGLDLYDGGEKKKPSLKRFIKKAEINYPVIIIEPKDVENYHVTSWPTIYLLDKDKKIIYKSRGFSETKFTDTLDKIIKEYLKIDE